MGKSKSICLICFNSLSVSFHVFTRKDDFVVCDYRYDSYYSGIQKGFFVAPNEIEKLISGLVDGYVAKSGKNIHELTVVLPQALFRVKAMLKTKNLEKKVTEKDIEEIKKIPTVVPEGFVHKQEIVGGFRCGQEGAFFDGILGTEGDTLQMYSVSVFLNEKAQELFDNIAKNIHVAFRFSEPLVSVGAQMKREGYEGGVLVYVNELSTDICYLEGGIPSSVLSFPIGTEHFVMQLGKTLNLDYPVAKELMLHVNLGLSLKKGVYTVFCDKKYDFPVQEINPALLEFCDSYAKEVQSYVRGIIGDMTVPLYIAGTYLQKVHGFCEIIGTKIDLPCYSLFPYGCPQAEPEEYLITAIGEEI